MFPVFPNVSSVLDRRRNVEVSPLPFLHPLLTLPAHFSFAFRWTKFHEVNLPWVPHTETFRLKSFSKEISLVLKKSAVTHAMRWGFCWDSPMVVVSCGKGEGKGGIVGWGYGRRYCVSKKGYRSEFSLSSIWIVLQYPIRPFPASALSLHFLSPFFFSPVGIGDWTRWVWLVSDQTSLSRRTLLVGSKSSFSLMLDVDDDDDLLCTWFYGVHQFSFHVHFPVSSFSFFLLVLLVRRRRWWPRFETGCYGNDAPFLPFSNRSLWMEPIICWE